MTTTVTNGELRAAQRTMGARSGAEWPRITVVTAVRNGARYIEQTIRSVVCQRYPNLEYIVADGASTDGTVEVIRQYESKLSWWVSEPDRGVYDALNKGFAHSTGEIMGWLNASDMLHTGSLFVVGSLFKAFPEVSWFTGRPTGFDSTGMPVYVGDLPRWSRVRFLLGANKHIQQESTFWRRRLWEQAGGCVDATRTDVSDFDLWVRFFRHARLYSVNALVGGYRFHADAISRSREYNQHCDEIAVHELEHMRWGQIPTFVGRLGSRVERVPKVRAVWYYVRKLGMRALYRVPGPDWPPIIEYRQGKWVMTR